MALEEISPSLPWLIFFRVMQGVTGGGLQPLSQAALMSFIDVFYLLGCLFLLTTTLVLLMRRPGRRD